MLDEVIPLPVGVTTDGPAPIDMSQKHPRFQLDRAFYDRVRAAKPTFRLVEKLVIPPYNGRGFRVQKGQTFRVINEVGPQIADVAFWNAQNPRETFGGTRTWLVEGWIIRVYTRLWSELPWFRPMMTCVEDTVQSPPDVDYHHHFLGNHCSPESNEMKFGVAGLNGCRVNLLQAIEPLGLTEDDLRENINVHEKNRADPVTGLRSIWQGDGKPGDYIEFYAEMDLLVGVSVCPWGDGSKTPIMRGPDVVFPLAIEVYETGIEPKEFPRWTDWRAKA